SNKETDQACRRASCHAMTQPASPSTPSGPAAISTNEGDRSRATKTRQVHPLPTRLRKGRDGCRLLRCMSLLLCRFSDADTHEATHALRRPASEKRPGTKSRWGNVSECRNYGDFAAGGEFCWRVMLHH